MVTRFAAACAFCCLFVGYAAQLPNSAEVDGTLRKLAGITGFRIRRPLRFELLSRAEVAKYLDSRLQDAVDPKEILLEELALRELGFISDEYRLRDSTLSLMTEQAAAFYDYNRKALFLSDWTPGAMRDTAVVHELAHALADQNFNLGRYVRKVSNDDEKSLAREAVVEGQATYLMDVFATKRPLSADTSQFERTLEPSGEYPEFDKAPLYVRMTMVFPYTWGMAFQAALVSRLGEQGFAEPFQHAPISTQQILHPDLYFAGFRPTRPTLPRAPKHWKVVVGGSLGELEHQVMIRQFGTAAEASEFASALRGAEFAITEQYRPRKHGLLYVSEWRDEAAAQRFFIFYKAYLAGRWKKLAVTRDEAGSFGGSGEKGFFLVEWAGHLVRAREGFPEPVVGK